METSTDKFEELIARRLLTQVEGEMKRKSNSEEGKPKGKLSKRKREELASPDFIKIEKNLTSLGFFTPSSKRIKNEKAKTITFTRTVDGNRVEAKVTIAPAALYGLPITADQDKFLALNKIITDIQQQEGQVNNPIGFTSTELLRLLSQGDAGKNYQEVAEWLDVMTSTTIISEGAVYLAGKKVFAKDRFHVFDRAVSVGKELEPGVTADKNYVWLSSWQLENINNRYLLPIDFDAYKELKNHIAKALVPLLQIWLFASQEEGYFEKRYDELCQILAIRQYRHLSEINRNFTPSLDELRAHGYIADWKVEKTTDKKAYKVIFYHGEKFHRDQDRRLGRKTQRGIPAAQPPAEDEKGTAEQVDTGLVAELTNRGILETAARKLLATVPADQPILDQLEWGDHLISRGSVSNFRNPPGFYLYLVKGNVTVPDTFETSRRRKLREEAQAARAQAEVERFALEQSYEDYCRQEIDQYIATTLSEVEHQQLIEAKKQDLLKQYRWTSTCPPETLNQLARGAARSEIKKRIAFTTFEAFCEEERARRTQRPQAQPATSLQPQAKFQPLSPAEQGTSIPTPIDLTDDSTDDNYLTV